MTEDENNDTIGTKLTATIIAWAVAAFCFVLVAGLIGLISTIDADGFWGGVSLALLVVAVVVEIGVIVGAIVTTVGIWSGL